ncbi:MAG: hypothetical protein SF182_01520 [Deltaproteobacteria bacterium]|nr:hypothetical protein [Deltaproteobacteria bacterium]
MLLCWNGHRFSSAMGPGVRGIQTICPTCGAGTESTRLDRSLRVIAIAPELFMAFLRGEASPAAVTAHPLPSDAEVVNVAIDREYPQRRAATVRLLIRSAVYSPVNPGDVVPSIEGPMFRRAAGAAGA